VRRRRPTQGCRADGDDDDDDLTYVYLLDLLREKFSICKVMVIYSWYYRINETQVQEIKKKTVRCFARYSQSLTSLSILLNVPRAKFFWMWLVSLFPMSEFCTPANLNDSGVFYAQFLTNLKSSASRMDGFARVAPNVHCVSVCIKSTSALLIQDTAWPLYNVPTNA